MGEVPACVEDGNEPRPASLREAFALFGLALVMLLGSGAGFSISAPGKPAGGIGFSLDEGFLFEYSVVAFGLAISSLLLARGGSSLLGECRRWFALRQKEAPVRWGRTTLGWIVAVTGIATALGLSLVDQPMRYDEAFTYLTFVEPGGPYLFYYPLPNNHVLYTLLAAGSDFLLGTSPASLRWPALLFGLTSVVLAFGLGRQFSGTHGGYLASAAMATCPFLISYATMGRGYTLLVLLVLAMIYVVIDDDRFDWKLKPGALATLGAVSLLVMPSAIYAIAGISLWAACVCHVRHRDLGVTLTRFVLPYASLGLLFTAVIYVPVLLVNRFQLVVDNRFFTRLESSELLHALAPHALATWMELTRGVGSAGLAALVLLMLLGAVASVRTRNRSLLLLLPAMLVGSAIVFFLKQSIPFPRTWIFLIPVVLLVADAGLAWLLGRVASPLRRVLLGLILLGTGIYAVGLWRSDAIKRAPDGGASPDASKMATRIDQLAADGDWLCARVPHDVPLRYYLSKRHPKGRTEFTESGAVHYIGAEPFIGNEAVSVQQVRKETRVGGLTLYGLVPSMSINDAGKSFHCWLRSGVFLG